MQFILPATALQVVLVGMCWTNYLNFPLKLEAFRFGTIFARMIYWILKRNDRRKGHPMTAISGATLNFAFDKNMFTIS